MAGIDFGAGLNAGDTVHVRGHTTDLTFVVGSMQIDNTVVASAGSGDSACAKVADRCRHGDRVFRVS